MKMSISGERAVPFRSVLCMLKVARKVKRNNDKKCRLRVVILLLLLLLCSQIS
jgi:hypothetical protein